MLPLQHSGPSAHCSHNLEQLSVGGLALGAFSPQLSSRSFFSHPTLVSDHSEMTPALVQGSPSFSPRFSPIEPVSGTHFGVSSNSATSSSPAHDSHPTSLFRPPQPRCVCKLTLFELFNQSMTLPNELSLFIQPTALSLSSPTPQSRCLSNSHSSCSFSPRLSTNETLPITKPVCLQACTL